MTIKTIIKKAIRRVELEGKILTPDFYAEAFCKEAGKVGIITDDCNHVEKQIASLNKEFQKELSQYRIKTMNELTRLLIAKLNRTKPSQCSEMVDSQTLLLKRILQVVSILHNKEASDLATKSLDLLNSNPTATQLGQFRQLWVNFITTYDDTFLQTLNSFGTIDTKDLAKSIHSLSLHKKEEKSENLTAEKLLDLEKISSLLIASLVPSIASSANETIANVSEKIRKNPALLERVNFSNEVKSAISLRIALDKESVEEMVESLDGLLDKLSLRLIDMIERSDSSTVDIQKIKHELDGYTEHNESNFKLAHKKLYTLAVALEENTQLLSKDLKDHSNEVNTLMATIQKLEKELEESRQESKEDFLTKLYNKRALDDFMKVKEGEFERYAHNYSIVMFDLDLFKLVNDNHGHEAGDAVLSAFAKILKQEGRTVDIVGRFGGEEFMAILSETDTKGGAMFAEKVRKHVEKARFMYKGVRINVTVSCGVSERKIHPSIQSTINSADEYLYEAKKNGRNQVAYKKR